MQAALRMQQSLANVALEALQTPYSLLMASQACALTWSICVIPGPLPGTVQVNGVMGEDGRLSSVGVLTRQWWLMVNARVGVDYEFNPAEVPDSEWPQDSGLRVDLQQMTSNVRSRNAEMHLAVTPGGSVSLTITLMDR